LGIIARPIMVVLTIHVGEVMRLKQKGLGINEDTLSY